MTDADGFIVARVTEDTGELVLPWTSQVNESPRTAKRELDAAAAEHDEALQDLEVYSLTKVDTTNL